MKGWQVLLVTGILVLGFWLRYQHYNQVPLPGDSLDEQSFSWLGLSLWKLGYPVGAIGVGGYQNTEYRYINVDRIFQSGVYASPVPINYPWFDHPPLLGLVTGGYAAISGAKVFEDTAVYIIRKPMVVLGVVALGLVMLVAGSFWGFWPAVLAGIVYAGSPLIVVSSRMVQAENLLIIWFLAIIWLLKKTESNKRNEIWFLIGILTGLAWWTKFSSLAILPVILWQIKKPVVKYFLMGLIPLIMMLGIYAGVFGIKTFLTVNLANTGREYALGTQSIYELVTKQRVTHTKFMTDGWIVLAWLGLVAGVWATKKMDLLQVFVASYLGVYILFGNFPHGWYATPLWPVLFIYLGKFVYDGIVEVNKNWLVFMGLLIPLGFGLNRLVDYQKFSQWAGVWRWGILGVLVILVSGKFKLSKWILVGIFATAVLVNAIWVGKLDGPGWYTIY